MVKFMKKVLGVLFISGLFSISAFADSEKGIIVNYYNDAYDNVKWKSVAYHTNRTIGTSTFTFSGSGDGFINTRGYTGVLSVLIPSYTGTVTVRVEGLAGTTTAASATNIIDAVYTGITTDYIYIEEEGLWDSIKVSVNGTATLSVIGNFSRRFK